MVSDEQYVSILREAWAGSLELMPLMEHCSGLEQGQRAPLAAILYQTWISRSKSPLTHLACFNLGANLSNQGDLEGAANAYRQAITLAPGFIQPRLNLGLVLERQGLLDQAIEQWTWVANHVPTDNTEATTFLKLALNHLGRVLESRKQYRPAMDFLSRSLRLDANQADVLHHWVFLRQRQCCWPTYIPIGDVSIEFMAQSTSALAMIALTDDPAVQLASARHFADKKVLKNLPPLAPPGGYPHRKIRIGYCSSDFCLHPVAMLMVELFELHNRDQFEIYGYCWSPEDGSDVRRRVIAAMDQFHRIHQLSDEAAARLIREHEIDILFDLQGQTAGARMNILAYRPAPIQITYLGLPATTGLDSIDYVIADRFLIPEAETPYYSEKPLYMPDIYQVSDRNRKVAPLPSRASCGLPDDAMVFCTFNNNYKYTQEMFEVWMNILRRVPNSVLWMLSDNEWAEANLHREAEIRGINPTRLVFAPRVSPENYLARYAVADLFLDSFPFNAGTTANDALWMGLPVLTRSGRTFASRMAGALLTAARLEELITHDLQGYEEKAVALGHDRDTCQRLKQHLLQEREQGPLFDTPRFTRHMEDRLAELTGRPGPGTQALL